MKAKTIKKQLARLWAATAHYEVHNLNRSDVEPERYFVPAKKPLTGKAARRLVGAHYDKMGACGGGWETVSPRPQFAAARRYIILATSEDGRPETLSISRADLNTRLR